MNRSLAKFGSSVVRKQNFNPVRHVQRVVSQHLNHSSRKMLSNIRSPVSLELSRRISTKVNRGISVQRVHSQFYRGSQRWTKTHQLKAEQKMSFSSHRVLLSFRNGPSAKKFLDQKGMFNNNVLRSGTQARLMIPSRPSIAAVRPSVPQTRLLTSSALPNKAISSTRALQVPKLPISPPKIVQMERASVTYRKNFDLRTISNSAGEVRRYETVTRHNPQMSYQFFTSQPKLRVEVPASLQRALMSTSASSSLSSLSSRRLLSWAPSLAKTVAFPIVSLSIQNLNQRSFCTERRLSGSQTHQNLMDAFAGESCANRRYLFFAGKADIEGHPEVASLFRSTAEGETGHANGHLFFLEEVGDPATDMPIGNSIQNLESAVAGETHEYTDMYPSMAKTARDEGFDEIADWFETLALAEKSHAGKFQRALDTLKKEAAAH